ncbi:MAG: 3-hydroxyisobutyrate dehydrogenase-like beta-hydroxyacid dehydrogenase [Paracoccaceae bacterium]|jgi:3-hydroxyisobutyrate dehydrogenase-like beta-hydroxyacid dehydrogenase
MGEKPKVGFVGVGMMGWGMAKNATEKGFSTLVVAHRKREAVDDLVSRGAVEVASVQEMAKTADIIVLCVTGSPQVEENIALILQSMRPGLTVIDTSTAEPDSTRRLAALLAEKGGTLVDAPLSRTPSHAWDGELTTFVSGTDEQVDKLRPLLSTWAAAIIPVGGDVGTAHAIKLVNNLVSIGYAALWSECYATLKKLDVAPDVLRELVRNSGMICGNFESFSKYVCDGDPNGHKFSLGNCQKDIGYYTRMAKGLSADRTISSGVVDLLNTSVDMGMADKFLPELVDSVLKINGDK